jgi:8-oxo-dGTP pyrophosphatase MutT (NUDIX family)
VVNSKINSVRQQFISFDAKAKTQMSNYQYKNATVLDAVSSFISSHDKEDYEGVFIIARQKNDLFQIFFGGTAADPDYVDEWLKVLFIMEAMLSDMVGLSEPDIKPQLHMIKGGNEQAETVLSVPDISTYPEIVQEVYQNSLHPGTCLNDESELIDDPGVCHPRLNDQGEWVTIYHPTAPKPMLAFDDPSRYAVMLPNGQTPESLNGIAFQPWQTAPKTLAGWAHVEGQVEMDEPALVPKHGKKLATGMVIMEPDGRFWPVAPANAFGGYKATFPKGRLEPSMAPQATAIKEAFQEAGLKVKITGLIGDFERSQTITRYYSTRRLGGLPTQMTWESQAVMLVPKEQLFEVLNHPNDHAVIQALNSLDTPI